MKILIYSVISLYVIVYAGNTRVFSHLAILTLSEISDQLCLSQGAFPEPEFPETFPFAHRCQNFALAIITITITEQQWNVHLTHDTMITRLLH